MLTGTITLAGWTTLAAGLTYPLSSPWLPDAALRVGDVRFTGVPVDVLAVAVGLGLLIVMPWLVQALARIDGALVRGLLR